MQRYRRVIAVVGFLVIVFAALGVTQKVVNAKFINDSTTIVNGFYAEEKDSIDVLVVGSSNSFCTIDPLVLYEQYGITAYDFGSSSQPMNLSLLYVKEAFKVQSPKVVALEVNMIPAETIRSRQENRLRWGLTDMPLTWDKLTCIYQSLGTVDAEYFSYVFPLLRYHSRWKELSKSDYTYLLQDKTNHTKGYLDTNEVTSQAVRFEDYELEGETWIEEDVLACLDEIITICRRNDAELILFKSPKEEWYRYDTQAVREAANARNIPFVDYNELITEVGLDPLADFRDNEHLNNSGARKISAHFGGVLASAYELADRRGEETPNAWDKALTYRGRLQNQPLCTQAQTVTECMELLQQEEGYVAVLSYKGGKNSNTGAKIGQHQWVYEDGVRVFTHMWQEDGAVHYDTGQTDIVLARRQNCLQVLIEDVDYYDIADPWNVVVYDTLTERVCAVLGFES